MELSLKFSETLADCGVYSIAFGDKFLITRSSKIREWAEKIKDDLNTALKLASVAEGHPSRKVIDHIKQNGITTGYVSLLEAASSDTVVSVQQDWLTRNEDNPLCLNKKFLTGSNSPRQHKSVDPDRKPYIPYKLIHERRNAKKQ